MDELDPRKKRKIERLLEDMEEEGEFVKSEELSPILEALIESLRTGISEFTERLEQAENFVDQNVGKSQREVKNVRDEIEEKVRDWQNTLKELELKVTSAKEMQEEMSSEVDLKISLAKGGAVLEAIQQAKEEIKLPTSEEIRDSLETLRGDSRLDKSAVKGIEDIEKRIQNIQVRPSGGFGNKSVFLHVDGVKKGLVNSLNIEAGDNTTVTHSVVNGLDTITIESTGGGGSGSATILKTDGTTETYLAVSDSDTARGDALEEAVVDALGGEGTVITLSPGTFELSTTAGLDIDGPITIRGAGLKETIIKMAGGQTGNCVLLSSGHVRFEDLSFDGNHSGSTNLPGFTGSSVFAGTPPTLSTGWTDISSGNASPVITTTDPFKSSNRLEITKSGGGSSQVAVQTVLTNLVDGEEYIIQIKTLCVSGTAGQRPKMVVRDTTAGTDLLIVNCSVSTADSSMWRILQGRFTASSGTIALQLGWAASSVSDVVAFDNCYIWPLRARVPVAVASGSTDLYDIRLINVGCQNYSRLGLHLEGTSDITSFRGAKLSNCLFQNAGSTNEPIGIFLGVEAEYTTVENCRIGRDGGSSANHSFGIMVQDNANLNVINTNIQNVTHAFIYGKDGPSNEQHGKFVIVGGIHSHSDNWGHYWDGYVNNFNSNGCTVSSVIMGATDREWALFTGVHTSFIYSACSLQSAGTDSADAAIVLEDSTDCHFVGNISEGGCNNGIPIILETLGSDNNYIYGNFNSPLASEPNVVLIGDNSRWINPALTGRAKTPTGDVDSSNDTYTVEAEPEFVIADGSTYFDGAGYTYSALSITMDTPPSKYIRVVY